MRYLFGFLCVCTLVGTLPLSANAQDEAATSEPTLEEPAPPSEPALKLEVDSTALEVTPTALPILEELERRAFEDLQRLEKKKQEEKKRPKRRRAIGIGVGVTVGVVLVGLAIGGAVAMSNSEF
jgi:hypothetical protein